jgi:hypothetical protein
MIAKSNPARCHPAQNMRRLHQSIRSAARRRLQNSYHRLLSSQRPIVLTRTSKTLFHEGVEQKPEGTWLADGFNKTGDVPVAHSAAFSLDLGTGGGRKTLINIFTPLRPVDQSSRPATLSLLKWLIAN